MAIYSDSGFITSRDTPLIRPTLDLNFAKDKRLDSRVTFTRASSATYTDELGVIRTVPNNVPRFDHDPVTGESLGLLVEESRTNVIVRSEQVTGRSWIYGQVAIDNALLSPNNTFTAAKIRSTQGNSLAFVEYSYYLSATSTYTFSIYAKAGEWTRVGIRGFYDGTSYRLPHTTIDLVTKQIIQSTITPTIVDYGNGWLRISITFTTDLAVNGSVIVECHNTTTTQNTEVGDGTSGIYIWGAQLEVGSFPTSYIPTPATFTSRSSTATYYDANGTIQTAGINVARSSAYFPDENGVMKPAGLLLEGSSTNLALSSEDFSNTTYWTATGQTITTNVATAPDGTLTADNVIPDAGTNSVRYLYYNANPYTMSTSTVYTTSIFVKKNGLRYFAFQVHDNGSGSGHRAGFDLDNGIVVASTVNNMGSGTGATASIVSYPNGWYRCIITGTTAPTGTSGRTAFSFTSSLDANASVSAITADGINGGYVWGHQVETGSYSTSYIPTAGSTVTRAADVSSSSAATRSADVAQITGSNFSSWYNQSEGTIYCSFLAPTRGTGSSSYQVMSLNDGTVIEHIGLSRSFDPVQINANIVTGYSTQASFSIYPIPVGSQKVALTYKSNYSNLSAGGVLSSADASLTVPNPTQLNIGQYSLYTQYGLNSTISRLTYYPVRFLDATLQTLTS